MRKMITVLMLMFMTVAIAQMSVQPSDTDISIEQTMVKPMADVAVTLEVAPIVNISDVPIVFETININEKPLAISIETITYQMPDSGIPISNSNQKPIFKQNETYWLRT